MLSLLAAVALTATPPLQAVPICGCHVAPEALIDAPTSGTAGGPPSAPPGVIDAVMPWTPEEARRLAGCSPGTAPPARPASPEQPPPPRGGLRR